MSEWQTMRTQNPLVANRVGFKSHHRHQPLKPLVSLFFREQAVFLLPAPKTCLAFRLLFFVCHFYQMAKTFVNYFQIQKNYFLINIFFMQTELVFSHLSGSSKAGSHWRSTRFHPYTSHLDAHKIVSVVTGVLVPQPFLYFFISCPLSYSMLAHHLEGHEK